MSERYDLAIIGSGPAGFTAGIYGSRANLKTAVFEGDQPGGQLMITTDVENYPGFPDGIKGPEMMEVFRKQAQKFGAKSIFKTIEDVDTSDRPFKLKTSDDEEYLSDAIIVATGASARLLAAKGEDKYWGAGISACATCDGFFFKDKKVFVIGGGDTAMEEATYLTHFAESVTIVHRRQGLRASQIMADRAKENPKIDFMLDSVLVEYLGEENMGVKKLTGAKIKNVKTGEITEHEVDGIFLAIGHDPNTKFLKGQLETDEEGYIQTKPDSTYTNVPGVFACGDCQDSVYRQAVTAAGTGCAAAIDADRWLGENK